jgi:protein-export membrane protein SecD
LVAVVSLLWYIGAVLFLFKIFGVTLTAAGIAGFIISIGIAVDANVLIFERAKEESRRGHKKSEAYTLGFGRAWSSIRDSNLSSLITAAVLFWFGTSLIQGFAVTLALGVIVSLVTALGVTRLFIAVLPFDRFKDNSFLLGSGFSR